MDQSSETSKLLVDWTHGDARPCRPKVRFNDDVRFRIIEDTSRMSHQEIQSVWFQPHENQDMRRNMKKTVKYMVKGYPEDDGVGRSYRGLEHLRSRDVLLSLQEGRERLLDAVLRVQDMGATPEEIAVMARQLSKSSTDRALWYAKNDAEEAESVVRSSTSRVPVVPSSKLTAESRSSSSIGGPHLKRLRAQRNDMARQVDPVR
mmetsp:Transcript_5223/g.14804  ORF Transcript_5223/g.14804 Transcript_5223/m.14804 type:complete len:204 (-) Transcript_5223:125-736(-)|eukprot:CAMPEP_0181056938 /NCGR_PEP_ID=MMETSP1070-20121207/19981_1 /TAXON_ID=265543 /ORGANISM="Minutocellus polymorphus, Strain NH13" /LENGTH=203 /DNA_ID=CAMNT_0023136313 /DNA_START=77 /DNA_END=688 /DNA_ORIENTATION=-